MNSFKI